MKYRQIGIFVKKKMIIVQRQAKINNRHFKHGKSDSPWVFSIIKLYAEITNSCMKEIKKHLLIEKEKKSWMKRYALFSWSHK